MTTGLLRRPGRLLAWSLLGLWLLVTVLPLLWMIRTALMYSHDLFSTSALIPERLTLINFGRVLGFVSAEQSVAAGGIGGASLNFLLYIRNSVVFAALVVAGQVTACTLAGYAFARLKFPGRDRLFTIFLFGLLVPSIFTVIPNFVLVRSLGWLNTFPGLVAPYFLMTPFAVFFMRQFFLSFPAEIEAAARLDGLGTLGILRRIVLPMSGPPIITLAVITAVTQWQEFLWPLLVGRQEGVRVLTVALSVFLSQSPGLQIDWPGLMSASSLSVVPVLVVLLVFGRRMVGSIQLTGFR
jgi:multiple sugar transport system permease protein